MRPTSAIFSAVRVCVGECKSVKVKLLRSGVSPSANVRSACRAVAGHLKVAIIFTDLVFVGVMRKLLMESLSLKLLLSPFAGVVPVDAFIICTKSCTLMLLSEFTSALSVRKYSSALPCI